MRKPALVFLGVQLALGGRLFSLQGFGVLTGRAMSNTTFWSISGPVICVVGLVMIGSGGRRRAS